MGDVNGGVKCRAALAMSQAIYDVDIRRSAQGCERDRKMSILASKVVGKRIPRLMDYHGFNGDETLTATGLPTFTDEGAHAAADRQFKYRHDATVEGWTNCVVLTATRS